MKKNIGLVLLVSFVLVLSGCGSSRPSTKSTDKPENISLLGTEQLKLLKDTYAKKFVPLFMRAGYYKDIYRGTEFMDIAGGTHQDCVGLINGNNDGGDLLESLMEDEHVRRMLSTKLYTPEYIKKLEFSVYTYIRNNYQKDFFSFYVCNVKPGVDLVAGYVWPKEEFPYHIDESGKVVVTDDFKKVSKLLMIKEGAVYELKNVSIFTAPDTYNEVAPCEAQFENNKIKWFCFAGFNEDKEGIKKAKYDYWLIDLNGKVSQKFSQQSKY